MGGVRPGIVLAIAIALTGCSRTHDQPGAVSADENRQLNEAAAMLDANSIDANAVADNESEE